MDEGMIRNRLSFVDIIFACPKGGSRKGRWMDGRRGRAKFPMRDKLEEEERRKSNNKARDGRRKATCFFVVIAAGHSI